MKAKNLKSRKLLINFYLDKELIRRCDTIVREGNTLFEDRSTLIRHCVKTTLPIIEKQIRDEQKGDEPSD
jgi:metal-responsive CopG/Arc/MetJ family transcriptional regulator